MVELSTLIQKSRDSAKTKSPLVAYELCRCHFPEAALGRTLFSVNKHLIVTFESIELLLYM